MNLPPKTIEAISVVVLLVTMLIAKSVVVDTNPDSDGVPLLDKVAPRPAQVAGQVAVSSLKADAQPYFWLYLVNSPDQTVAVEQIMDDWNNWRVWSGKPVMHSVIVFSQNRDHDFEMLEPYRQVYTDAGVGIQIIDLRNP